MEEAKAEGKLKSIGVSNMTPKIWNTFVPQFATMPSVNQVEFNPFFRQKELRRILDKHDVKLEAWYPLGHGDKSLIENDVVLSLAKKYHTDAGQIILKFELQEGAIVLPKSQNPARIKSNLELFDFELSEEDMAQLRALDRGKGAHDPDDPGVAEMLLSAYKIED